ncbi:hypothetical protein LY76DRAFT_176521 [Colletotrichum caudatum]|nr:hypothetical protein LY76DRAFT_176521 [Colletotrichum caudatum]
MRKLYHDLLRLSSPAVFLLLPLFGFPPCDLSLTCRVGVKTRGLEYFRLKGQREPRHCTLSCLPWQDAAFGGGAELESSRQATSVESEYHHITANPAHSPTRADVPPRRP